MRGSSPTQNPASTSPGTLQLENHAERSVDAPQFVMGQATRTLSESLRINSRNLLSQDTRYSTPDLYFRPECCRPRRR